MSDSKKQIDLLIATDWEYDRDFVQLLLRKAHSMHLSALVVRPRTLPQTISLIKSNELEIAALFDRASDTSTEFYELQKLLAKRAHIIEPLAQMRWASDKATMHLEFIANGLHTPYTFIIESFDDNKHVWLSVDDLAFLGRPFIIKPANTTGGGVGVVDGAESLHDVLAARREFKSDKYLLQEKVKPLHIDDKRFWFRGFYSFGLVQCVWWDDTTHIYKELLPEEVLTYGLSQLFAITEKISTICKLNFFSTEICLTSSDTFIVVDYVNEACDMRLQSLHADGVPDTIVKNIVMSICSHVKMITSQKQAEHQESMDAGQDRKSPQEYFIWKEPS
ncbi:hypothetical protein JW998_14975 [candidate division KSB1 bacterium]|nr:hypothetical protein [candidate division KSB1 bacterium]